MSVGGDAVSENRWWDLGAVAIGIDGWMDSDIGMYGEN